MRKTCIYIEELPSDAVEIPEYPNQYATPDGRIFARFGRLKQRRFGRNSCGYPICGLRRADGARVFKLVHRIIALMFVAGDTSLTVNHIDMDKLNCASANLEWVTHQQNHIMGHVMKPEWGKQCGEMSRRINSVAIIATNPDTKEEIRFASGRKAAEWVGRITMAGNISKACIHGRAAYGFLWRKA